MRHRQIAAILALGVAPGLAGCAHEDVGCVALGALITGALDSQADIFQGCEINSSTDPDYIQRVKLAREKAEKGDAGAQYDLGYAYEYGRGVAKDEAEATTWYTKSSDQGYKWAQLAVGLMYQAGRGVPRDNVGADTWCTIVIINASGDDDRTGLANDAATTRYYLEKRMTPAQIAEAKKLASEWRPVGAGATATPAASTAPTTGVSQPISSTPAPPASASSHPRIGPV